MFSKLKTVLLFSALAIAMLAAQGQASRWWHGKNKDVRHTDIVVTRDQTVHGDVTGDKNITVDGVLDGDCVGLGGPVAVNGRVTGDVVAMGGPVAVAGEVDGDVVAMGGPVEVSGTVEGDIRAVGGIVTLKSSATVNGNISTVGGRVERDGAVALKGDVNETDLRMLGRLLPRLASLRADRGFGHEWSVPEVVGLAGFGLLVLFMALSVGFLLLLVPPVFFPSNVDAAAGAMRADFWKMAGMGLLVTMCIVPGCIALVISIIGIPLVPVALLLLAAGAVLGFAAFSALLCGRFCDGIGRPAPGSRLGRVACGYAVIAAAVFIGKMLPLVGGILALAGFMTGAFGLLVGLGAAVCTRMGTRPVFAAAEAAARPAVAPSERPYGGAPPAGA